MQVREGDTDGADCTLTMTHDAWREISDHPACQRQRTTSRRAWCTATGNASMLAFTVAARVILG
ncbi:MAG: hypothetical protein IPG17_13620 [Sandaracinaceae bacterium]|nr:hypothetical protein [Sandaracinaceae bacterium]